MQFTLIDRITDLQPGVSITAVKALSMAEDYLQDHFPRFPVMPGVLMLEAMFQASSWLIYASEDFRDSTIVLREVRNVKYADFVQPGEILKVHSELIKSDERKSTFKAQGSVDGTLAVSGRMTLERFNVVDVYPERAAWDAYARIEKRKTYNILMQAGSSTKSH